MAMSRARRAYAGALDASAKLSRLMVEIGAAGGRAFLPVQQRIKENTVREAFLRQLDTRPVPYSLRRQMQSDKAFFPEFNDTGELKNENTL